MKSGEFQMKDVRVLERHGATFLPFENQEVVAWIRMILGDFVGPSSTRVAW